MLRFNLGRYSIHFIMLLLIMVLSMPLINKRQDVKQAALLQEELLQEIQQEMRSGSAGVVLGLSLAEKKQLNLGANPERRILQNLAKQPDVFPKFAADSSSLLLLEESVVLNSKWVLASFQVASQQGQALYVYQHQENDKFSWKLLAFELSQ